MKGGDDAYISNIIVRGSGGIVYCYRHGRKLYRKGRQSNVGYRLQRYLEFAREQDLEGTRTALSC
jgi:hypothetical protein